MTYRCQTCGASAAQPTPGCAECDAIARALPVEDERAKTAQGVGNVIPIRAASVPPPGRVAVQVTATATAHYPRHELEVFPDARHDDAGEVFHTGKVRALRPADAALGPRPTPSGTLRPPVLASEALRADLRPLEPGNQLTRALGVTCGVVTAVIGATTLGLSGAGVVVVLLGALLTCTALLPLAYAARAAVQVALATALLTGSTVVSVLMDANSQPGLVVPVVALAAGLLFRSWHRASRDARVIVASGIALCALWLGLSGTLEWPVTVEPRWQTWLPVVVRLLLAPVLLVALLAFMGESTTGGCAVWAGCVLGWFVAVAVADTVVAAWGTGTALPNAAALPRDITAARLLAAASAPALASGIAQLLVVASSKPDEIDQRAERPT